MEATTTFDNACGLLRTKIKEVGQQVLELKGSVNPAPSNPGETQNKGEMLANLMLAYRHLEDAAMRVGKAIQAFEGGSSIYDNNDAVRASKALEGK